MSPAQFKIHRILLVILVASLAICLRVLHLGTIQRESLVKEAEKPRSRTILQRANRGTIRDRFGRVLAINRICYHAAIYYNQIAQIPAVQWKEERGKRIRVFPRKEYIRKLSSVLADLLHENQERIEDLIYAKASLFPNVPFIIKSKISENEYYTIKGMEKDFPGIFAEIASERFYPLHKVGCHILGTVGPISHKQYTEIAEETSRLQEIIRSYEEEELVTLPKGYACIEEVYHRLGELKEKAYTLNDSVGKSGIEAEFEESLRGFFGKRRYEVDQRGRLLREIPGGRASIAGQQVTLSISAELQQFAEELLSQNEKQREGKSIGIDPSDKQRKVQKQPWIKGGSIVAIDPNNGEVLALASYPRFDPNDFVQKVKRLYTWLENEDSRARVWDGLISLVKEGFNGRRFIEEEAFLTWDLFLQTILPKDGPLRSFFTQCDDVKAAIQIQEDFETLRYFSGLNDPLTTMKELFSSSSKKTVDTEGAKAKKRLIFLLESLQNPGDQLFAIDLCRVCIDSTRFGDELILKIGTMKLNEYRKECQEFLELENQVIEKEKKRFRETTFRTWREENQKAFLSEKRKIEKEKKHYARPYIDYLDQKEEALFKEHWKENRVSILLAKIDPTSSLGITLSHLPSELKVEFLRTFRSFEELDRPLFGTFQNLKTEKDLAAVSIPKDGFGYLRSYAFQCSAPQGSLFKLVSAYEGVRQGRTPVLIDDESKQGIVAYSLNGTPYPRIYKGGRLPKSSLSQIGKIDLIGALEFSSNPYFSILAGDYLSDPEDLLIAAKSLGYGAKTGIALPGETAGYLPTDLKQNRTGLYSFAIGQHTLLSTPLQASLMLSSFANGGKILKPKITKTLSGFSPDRQSLAAFESSGEFGRWLEKKLHLLGIPFALFTSVKSKSALQEIGAKPIEEKRMIPFSSAIRAPLFEGMDRGMWSPTGRSRPSNIRSLRFNPALLADHLSLEHQVIGKTSTAEILYQPNVNPSSRAQMVKHTWFGLIAFSPDYSAKARYDHPELVVVVFLRFNDAGKEGAPLATQMVKKWREIKKKHGV